MNDLNSVPDDLRTCLEAALSEEASPATLDQHLPQIRQIVVHLLQGLKVKQAKWRAAKRQHDLDASNLNRPNSSRDLGAPPDRPQLPHPSIRGGPRSLAGPKSREDLRRMAVAPPSSSDHHRSQPCPSPVAHSSSRSSGSSDLPFAPKFNDSATASKPSHDHHSSGSASKSRLSPVSRAVRSVNDFSDRLRGNKASPPSASSPPPMHPPHGNTVIPPARSDDSYQPPIPRSPRSESSNQAQASSLEALRKAEMLQRRASKRFSTYTYNKIAATASPHKRSGDGPNLGLGPNVPALPRSPNSLTFLISRDDHESAREISEAGRELMKASNNQRSYDAQPTAENSGSTYHTLRPGDGEVGSSPLNRVQDSTSALTEKSETSIRMRPITPDSNSLSLNPMETPPHSRKLMGSSSTGPQDPSFTVFLQLGRDVKKAKLDSTPTIASLRVLFMDRFQFNPGSDSFPEIYLRDPQSGIQYQLEDLNEVKDRVVLSLNIDALDQVKTHIDSGLSSLAREIKDLKSSITNLRRQSIPPTFPASLTTLKSSRPSTPSPETQLKPTSRQANKHTEPLPSPNEKAGSPTVASLSEPSNAANSPTDLKLQQLNGTFKDQYTEVQSLRRDLGILRQLYSTFTGETKNMLAGLRLQTESVKQAATAKVASSRTFIDSGKAKVESQSQDLVTKVESLQDTVEDLKQDVTNRKVKPKPSTMETISQSIQTVKTELERFTNHIATIKPAWKKSWEDELQNIVDEQQLLNYQEDLIKDLKEDLEAASNLFGHVEHYLDARKASKVKPKEFVLPMTSPTGSNSGLMTNPRDGLETVLMQVKGLEPNPESRLKAIEAAERIREKNLKEVAKENEFAQELAGFVGNKKLKMTGGHEEIERLRNFKSEQTIKALSISFKDPNLSSTDSHPKNDQPIEQSDPADPQSSLTPNASPLEKTQEKVEDSEPSSSNTNTTFAASPNDEVHHNADAAKDVADADPNDAGSAPHQPPDQSAAVSENPVSETT